MSEELSKTHVDLMEKIASCDDVVVCQLFTDDRQPLKSPMDKDKRRAERIDLEESYISVRHF